jgi:hypothetical protein
MTATVNNFVLGSAQPTELQLGLLIPEGVQRQGLLSGTSEAIPCFVGQGFSNKLQVYLMNYVAAVSSYYPMYG